MKKGGEPLTANIDMVSGYGGPMKIENFIDLIQKGGGEPPFFTLQSFLKVDHSPQALLMSTKSR